MTFRLRDFRSDDFDTLYAIDQTCFPSGISYSRSELSYSIDLRNTFTVVAETSGRQPHIAGFLVGQKHGKGTGHIVTIDTLVQHRRSGLGSLLMDTAESRLVALGCNAIVLEVAVDNAPAIAFYKRLGYFVLKTIPRYYQGRLDALMMAKRVAAKSPTTTTARRADSSRK